MERSGEIAGELGWLATRRDAESCEPDFHQRMTSAVTGAVIRCLLPIDVAESHCASLAELAVQRLFQIVNPDAPESIYLEAHAPILEHDIPPECIDIEFLAP